jgi:hypothetical protein
MSKRIQRLVLSVSALAALALGGSVIAQAQSSSATKAEPVATRDTDTVQSGDQTTPDRPAAASTTRAVHRTHATHVVRTAASSEQPGSESSEAPGAESPAANDGPGGHADPPGNSTADHQFQGNE